MCKNTEFCWSGFGSGVARLWLVSLGRLQLSKGLTGAGESTSQLATHMAGKLLLVLPEGLCSPKHGPPQGYLSIFKTWQLAFPRERKESKLIMRHMKHISNFYSDSCPSVYPCCRHKTCDLQSIKFYYTGTTMPNDSTHVYPPKKDKQPVAYRGKKKTSMKL